MFDDVLFLCWYLVFLNFVFLVWYFFLCYFMDGSRVLACVLFFTRRVRVEIAVWVVVVISYVCLIVYIYFSLIGYFFIIFYFVF